MRLPIFNEPVDWTLQIRGESQVKVLYRDWFSRVEKLMEQAIKDGLDLAVVHPRMDWDGQNYLMTSHYVFLGPDKDIPASALAQAPTQQWTRYLTSTTEARAILAQLQKDRKAHD